MRMMLVAVAVGAMSLAGIPWLCADGVPVDSGSVIEIRLPQGVLIPDQPGDWTFQGVLTVEPSLDADGISETVADAFRSLFMVPVASGDLPATADVRHGSHLARARSLLLSGDASGARFQLEEALDGASWSDLPELRFTLASALALGGDLAEARHQLSLVAPGPSDGWAPDFALLKSALLLDNSDYTGEIACLDQWSPKLKNDPPRSSLYHFLRALGDRGMHDAAAEKRELLRVRAPSDTALGATAASLLGDL